MISHKFFAKLSTFIGKGKSLAGEKGDNKPFGRVNVIIIGDFHQFPPVARKKSAASYYPCDPSKDSAEELLGQKIYEQFTTVVHLKEQVHVTDPQWNDLLRHIWHGSCGRQHIELLHSLILTNLQCPPTDFISALHHGMMPFWSLLVMQFIANGIQKSPKITVNKVAISYSFAGHWT